MNLSPDWVDALASQGWDCVHWSSVGDPKAPDQEIIAWALANDRIVFTHDLDFGTLLALTRATGPSVIQVRGQNILPDHMASLVVAALKQHESDLESGALVVVEESKLRVRVLPI
ncbi:DUF5615 family PIN-like protein [Aeoliella sp. ICT_H6.2]|uniref:DUF5615 family PIN-like protein n=2 Tax=Aeoliella straminimaris TaxID=2954799 RepID=A0A9X2FGP1_9BACT|nr:DUF5615 family PIN-like protein [Aeoliella straminimaris]